MDVNENSSSSTRDTWAPLSELGWSQAAAAFNAGYSGYVIPINMSADDLRQRALAETVDLDRSYVVFELEAPVGIVLIARRGSASRLAALGVAPHRRGGGLGRAMLRRVLDESGQRADVAMELEVIDSNATAIKLYEAVGFRTVDRLLGFELKQEPSSHRHTLLQEDADGIVAAVAADPSFCLPWQLAAESLKSLAIGWTVASAGEGTRAIVNLSRDDAVLVRFVHTPPELRLRGAARRLIQALIEEAAGRPIRVSQHIPARFERFARHMGFQTTVLRQLKMQRQVP